MKLSELKQRIDRIVEVSRYDQEVMIAIKLPYATVGARPMTAVKSVGSGFDWEQGKFIIWPETDLYPSNDELKETFKDMEKRAGELFRKNMELERELKELKKKYENT